MSDDAKRDIYREVCANYRAIDDLRTKLLGLLPIATGAGALLLVKEHDTLTSVKYLPAVGVFGFLATLGLFSYELHGIKKCGWLIRAGADLEASLGVAGPFLSRPHEIGGFVDEPFAASVIYPATLAAWAALAFATMDAWVAIPVAALVFIVAFLASLLLVRRMERDLANEVEYGSEPELFTRADKRARRIAGEARRRHFRPAVRDSGSPHVGSP